MTTEEIIKLFLKLNRIICVSFSAAAATSLLLRHDDNWKTTLPHRLTFPDYGRILQRRLTSKINSNYNYDNRN